MDKQQIRTGLRQIEAERKNLDKREKALNDLLATFEEPVKPKQRRVPGKVRDREVLELLRKHPKKDWDNASVAESTGMPYTSAGAAMQRLAEAKQVEVVMPGGPGERMAPVIKHKPVKVVPGEGVKAA